MLTAREIHGRIVDFWLSVWRGLQHAMSLQMTFSSNLLSFAHKVANFLFPYLSLLTPDTKGHMQPPVSNLPVHVTDTPALLNSPLHCLLPWPLAERSAMEHLTLACLAHLSLLALLAFEQGWMTHLTSGLWCS